MFKATLWEELLGSWLIVASFLNMGATQLSYHDVLIGIVVSVLGIAKYSFKNYKGIVLTVIGFWLIITAYIPAMLTSSFGTLNNLTAGIFILALALKTREISKKSST